MVKDEIVDAAKQLEDISKSRPCGQFKASLTGSSTTPALQISCDDAPSCTGVSIAPPSLIGDDVARKLSETPQTVSTLAKMRPFELLSCAHSTGKSRCTDENDSFQSAFSTPSKQADTVPVLIPGSSRNLQIGCLYYSSCDRPIKRLRCQPEGLIRRISSRKPSLA